MAEDNLARYKDDGRDGFHTDYAVVNRYESNPWVFMLGVTSPEGFAGANAAFVQLAAENLTLISDWTACRVGSRPTAPDPALINPDWVILLKMAEKHSLGLAPDGVSVVYRLSGTYVYGKKTTSADTFSQTCYPVGPWMDKDFPRDTPGGLLEKGIIDGGGGGGLAGTTAGNGSQNAEKLIGTITRG